MSPPYRNFDHLFIYDKNKKLILKFTKQDYTDIDNYCTRDDVGSFKFVFLTDNNQVIIEELTAVELQKRIGILHGDRIIIKTLRQQNYGKKLYFKKRYKSSKKENFSDFLWKHLYERNDYPFISDLFVLSTSTGKHFYYNKKEIEDLQKQIKPSKQ
jgi:hypothetical protein